MIGVGRADWFFPAQCGCQPAVSFKSIEFPPPVPTGPPPVGALLGVPLFEPKETFNRAWSCSESLGQLNLTLQGPGVLGAADRSASGAQSARGWEPRAGQQEWAAGIPLAVGVEPLTIRQPETTLYIGEIEGPAGMRVSLVLDGPAVDALLNNDPAGFLNAVGEQLPAELRAALRDPLQRGIRFTEVLAGFGRAAWETVGPKVAFSAPADQGTLGGMMKHPLVRTGAGGLLVGGTLWLNQQGGLQGLGVGELPGGGQLLSLANRPIPIRLWQRSWGDPERLMFQVRFCALENLTSGQLGYRVEAIRIKLGEEGKSEMKLEGYWQPATGKQWNLWFQYQLNF